MSSFSQDSRLVVIQTNKGKVGEKATSTEVKGVVSLQTDKVLHELTCLDSTLSSCSEFDGSLFDQDQPSERRL